jgi:hypothetical protein
MGLVHTTAHLHEAPVIEARPFITDAGEPCAWVDVGEHGELSVYGQPEALRRLAAALVVAADAAETLGDQSAQPAAEAAPAG